MFQNKKDGQTSLPEKVKAAQDEAFEILDLTHKNDGVIHRLLGDVNKTSPISQVAVGGGTGWLTGYCVIKVGKAAALTVLLTGLAVKVAHDKGYITINRRAVNEVVDKVQEQAKILVANKSRSYSDMIAQVYHSYKYLSIGFTGGFLAAVLF